LVSAMCRSLISCSAVVTVGFHASVRTHALVRAQAGEARGGREGLPALAAPAHTLQQQCTVSDEPRLKLGDYIQQITCVEFRRATR